MARETYGSVEQAVRAALNMPRATELSSSVPPLALAGDERLIDVAFLARGGMGSVYRAFDTSLGRDVAIKLVRPGQLQPELVARLRREAHALAQLHHPGIVQLLRLDEREGQLMVVLEYVVGTPLARHLRSLAGWPERARVVLACGEGLCAVHGAGFVHRDFKPDNVIVRDTGEPCLLDFGLVRSVTAERTSIAALTLQGQVLGTQRYMAPEQRRGERADARSDQYSLGVVFFEAVVVEPVTYGPPWPWQGVPEAVRPALKRMLAGEPRARFRSLREALSALRRVTQVR